jgi:hypothetical protein
VYVPAEHGVQVVAPALEYDPASHGEHFPVPVPGVREFDYCDILRELDR